MKKTIFLAALSMLFFGVMAQDSSTAPAGKPTTDIMPAINVGMMKSQATNQGRPGKLSYDKKAQYAENLFIAGNYFQALDLYQELYDKKGKGDMLLGIAECERQSRDYKSAEASYKKLIDIAAGKYPLAYYHYAQMLKMNGKYQEAKAAFDKFTSMASGNSGYKDWLQHAQVESAGCDFALNAIAHPVDYTITHLDAPLNKPRTEFAPVALNENTLYYSSINDDSMLNGSLMKDRNVLLSHIYASTKVNGVWTEGSPLPRPINNDEIHSGYSALTNNGKRMYFTECTGEGNNEITCKIFVTNLDKNNTWDAPRALSDRVNKPGTNNTQPAVVHGNNGLDTLYFSSNRPGGKGGYDIYYCLVDNNGVTGEAINLGDSVNTQWDEKTPFFWEKKGILFFASDGRIGLGGFDNYYVKRLDNDNWGSPVNLGYPVNSSADDYGYSVGEDNKSIFYFVSNRPGIIGLKSATCCDDIWEARSLFIPKIAVSGNLTERLDSSQTLPLEGVRVELFDITSGIPKLIKTDSLIGKTTYFYDLQPDKKYNLKFQKQGHFSQYQDVSTMGMENSDTVIHDMMLDKIITNKNYVLNNIYYDFNSAELNAQAKGTLDTLANLLKDNPGIVIELSSHTDSIGGDEFNMKLSQARAEACVSYLIAKGIDSVRLIPKGYGRSEPIAPNSIKHKDNPEGRALNRRTQYKVIGSLERKGDQVIFERSEPPKGYDNSKTSTAKKGKSKAKGNNRQ